MGKSKKEKKIKNNVAKLEIKKKRIHPIIMYPFSHPKDEKHIKFLYEELIRKLMENSDTYFKPITILNQQTNYTNTRWRYDSELQERFARFHKDYLEKYSQVEHVWCVDTCQMWLEGFGLAFDNKDSGEDVFWLIPGDFNYADKPNVLTEMIKLPEIVLSNDQDLSLGEIEVDINSSKQLIDTYGTYGLLYNWFPHEAQKIRKKTDKPRTEFFAIGYGFLRDILQQRWFPYEQTIVILLKAIIANKRVHTLKLGRISDLPQGRDSLTAAMQQVERTERVLKLVWRDQNQQQLDWAERFKKLDMQSQQIRAAALVILENLLVYPE